ncbi:replication initiation negative regulator SeqA [Shewanella sp.]|uniref:replication initiation negative regulator SeqA n=1 Tax=Shewanella sp. TaxID=50422 RepID=UPI004053CC28
MKYIEVDEELYRFIASKTERIGESASDILRRLLILPVNQVTPFEPSAIDEPSLDVAHHQASNLVASSQASISSAAPSQTHGNNVASSTPAVPTEPSGQLQAKAPHNGYQPGQLEGHRSEPQALAQVHSEHLSPNRSVMDFNALVNEHLLSQQKGAVGRFMWLLEGLAAMAPSQFNKVLLVQGKGRLYFARSKDELLASSASANPKEIGTTGYWVTTNNNTAKKQAILIEVLTKLRCDETLATAIADHICDKIAE